MQSAFLMQMYILSLDNLETFLKCENLLLEKEADISPRNSLDTNKLPRSDNEVVYSQNWDSGYTRRTHTHTHKQTEKQP